ncbi:hypothetical protein GPEL0_01r3470 [Geoanaerobacter pelophilus]|uniref:Uncharacterized protein n=1 Tax=Geoanaerobacter pelophilus TaxID=60036 RepID=A0ABQ0MKF9_9BACT|nr:hypothetical protein GPEL0_01r3470 [Geoanaerobacter pelophilus]
MCIIALPLLNCWQNKGAKDALEFSRQRVKVKKTCGHGRFRISFIELSRLKAFDLLFLIAIL